MMKYSVSVIIPMYNGFGPGANGSRESERNHYS